MTYSTKPMWQQYMDLCPEKDRVEYEKMMESCGPNPDWAVLQKAFLDGIDQYLDVEIQKPNTKNIRNHEAGGQFRIAFPHLLTRSREDVKTFMKEYMENYRKFQTTSLYHGYINCNEVHHDVETFIYFQNPLLYYQFPGHETALESILDFVEHVGNWAEGVPDWYDWEKHGFVSMYLGTREVKNYPPYDYQEANHLRFSDEAMIAWLYTKEQKYLDLVCDYCDRWCDHIEAAPEHGPIPCQIMPEGVVMKEMLDASIFQETEDKVYQVFYSIMQDYTMVDIFSAMLDAYTLTGNERYLAAAKKNLDQCFYNGNGIRPAIGYANGKWIITCEDPNPELEGPDRKIVKEQYCTEQYYLPRNLLRYITLTGDLCYKDAILRWAKDVDEENGRFDQVQIGIFVLAHFLDGDEKWLERAYKMALRYKAFTEFDDMFHQCSQYTRQGSKSLIDILYSAILGDPTYATRGEMARPMFRYEVNGQNGLDGDVAVRVWFENTTSYHFEVKNKKTEDVKLTVRMADGGKVTVVTDKETDGSIWVPANSAIKGIFRFER